MPDPCETISGHRKTRELSIMKLLIAYDGSKDAEAAIDDLRGCGLPATGSAEVISVAEVWLPPPGSLDAGEDQPTPYVEKIIHECRQKGDRAVAEAEILTKFAAGRVKAALPEWEVTAFASYGSPGWEIVSEAEKLHSDLILVGAQGHSFLSRMVLGSISQRVLTEAHCSVRVGRGRIDLDSGPQRIIVGFDGSRGANAAVAAVAAHEWNEGTEVRLIAVSESLVPATIGRFVTPVLKAASENRVSETALVELSAASAINKLKARGLVVSFRKLAGNPKQVLPDEAEKWGVDCIFVGANAWGSRLERFLIGSTSAAVAARAHCSVEVVRAKVAETQQVDHPRQNGMQPKQSGVFKEVS
jgi:nucleotide-binding universal stress UspA family protein